MWLSFTLSLRLGFLRPRCLCARLAPGLRRREGLYIYNQNICCFLLATNSICCSVDSKSWSVSQDRVSILVRNQTLLHGFTRSNLTQVTSLRCAPSAPALSQKANMCLHEAPHFSLGSFGSLCATFCGPGTKSQVNLKIQEFQSKDLAHKKQMLHVSQSKASEQLWAELRKVGWGYQPALMLQIRN